MSAEPLELDELVEHWTLLDGDREFVAGKRGGGRLAFFRADVEVLRAERPLPRQRR